MKTRTILALSTALMLTSGALQAQADLTSPEATQLQEQTNASSRSLTGTSGLTVTGEVVSVTDTSLVIKTTTGNETVILNNQTQKPVDLAAGDRVAVDFNRTSQGVMVATQVRPQTEPTGESTLTQSSEPIATDDALAGDLPDTASDLPLVAALGLLFLAGAIVLRAAKRHA